MTDSASWITGNAGVATDVFRASTPFKYPYIVKELLSAVPRSRSLISATL